MAHTFDPAMADRLEDLTRYRFCSRDELLWMLDPRPTDSVADLGSGTGFYTVDVAPFVETVYGVDLQFAMHEKFVAKGLPTNVDLVTAPAAALPFNDDSLDRAYSTMTFHEFVGTGALEELWRTLTPGGRLVTVDWSANGGGEDGPPIEERLSLKSAKARLSDVGFTIEHVADRPETFVLVATC